MADFDFDVVQESCGTQCCICSSWFRYKLLKRHITIYIKKCPYCNTILKITMYQDKTNKASKEDKIEYCIDNLSKE